MVIVGLLILLTFIPASISVPIVNGKFRPKQPSFGEYPFHASLMQVVDRGRYFHTFCGGSLIHPRWVLSAAHCIRLDRNERALKPREIYVALGSVYRTAQKAQVLGVRRTVMHPTYIKTDRNDISLLQLKKPAKLGSNVNLVRLHINNKESLLGKTAFLTGFGVINDKRQSPTRLRKATLHITNYNKCSSYTKFKNIELCAASTLREGKACDGDSGGPLFIIKNNKRSQIGITSYLARSAKCEQPDNNSVYTRVSNYITWISKVTGVNFHKYNQ